MSRHRYTCPDCQAKSHEVTTQAEADQLLETHRRYFCRRPRPSRTTTARTSR